MILVVCPNLALDRTLSIGRLRPGSVHRCSDTQVQPGGKGVNVMRALGSLEAIDSLDRELDARLCGFQGGAIGEAIAAGLDEEAIAFTPAPIDGTNRVCTIVVDTTDRRTSRVTVFNETGPDPSASQTRGLDEVIAQQLRGARVVAFMGSLPPGMDSGFFHRWILRCRQEGVESLLDSSSEPLRLGVEAAPEIVCPNLEEAETLAGYSLDSESSKRRLLGQIRARGVRLAVITLGAEGAIAASPDWVARVKTTDSPRVVNPTGAGDSFAAGLIAGRIRGLDDEQCLRLAVAAGTASVERGYGRFPRVAARVEATRFEPI